MTAATDRLPTATTPCRSTAPVPAADPNRILDLSWGIARTGTLVTALELDMFTAVSDGASTAPELAARLGVAERAANALVTALLGLGLLEEDGAGRLALAADAQAYLVRGRPGYLGELRHMHKALNFRLWPRLTEAARTGEPLQDIFAADGSDVWQQVTGYLDALGDATAGWFAGRLAAELPSNPSVLDLGCGSGGYSRVLARALPGSRVTALDRPEMATTAQRFAEADGLGKAIRCYGGDLCDLNWGGPHHLVLMANLLHGYDEPDALDLLRRAEGVLAADGQIAIVEIVPDHRASDNNPVATFFGLQMLMTSAGRAYTHKEYRRLLTSSGFGPATARRIPAGPHTLITARPRQDRKETS